MYLNAGIQQGQPFPQITGKVEAGAEDHIQNLEVLPESDDTVSSVHIFMAAAHKFTEVES